MNDSISRREVLGLLATTGALGLWPGIASAKKHAFNIRTITAGVSMTAADNLQALEATTTFLGSARGRLVDSGYAVQTVRVASQPLVEYLDWRNEDSIEHIKALDAFAAEQGVVLSIGPLNNTSEDSTEFSEWAIEMLASTQNTSCSMIVAGKDSGLNRLAIKNSARIMRGISQKTAGGEGNFRFVAAANCPPGTPFFPAGWFDKEAFSIGLESPRLLLNAFETGQSLEQVQRGIKDRLETSMSAVVKKAKDVEQASGRAFLGIDTSPAPNLDISIGRVIEKL